jgi:hypothetical protein
MPLPGTLLEQTFEFQLSNEPPALREAPAKQAQRPRE